MLRAEEFIGACMDGDLDFVTRATQAWSGFSTAGLCKLPPTDRNFYIIDVLANAQYDLQAAGLLAAIQHRHSAIVERLMRGRSPPDLDQAYLLSGSTARREALRANDPRVLDVLRRCG